MTHRLALALIALIAVGCSSPPAGDCDTRPAYDGPREVEIAGPGRAEVVGDCECTATVLRSDGTHEVGVPGCSIEVAEGEGAWLRYACSGDVEVCR